MMVVVCKWRGGLLKPCHVHVCSRSLENVSRGLCNSSLVVKVCGRTLKENLVKICWRDSANVCEGELVEV